MTMMLHNNSAMSEEECANLAGYSYLATNEVGMDMLQSQRDFISRTFGVCAEGRQCGCSVVGGIKCFDYSCPNLQYNLACNASCGHECCNKPVTLRQESKCCLGGNAIIGHSLFACKNIREHERVGEFTGVFRLPRQGENVHESPFCIEITPIGQIVDASQYGSMTRCIRRSNNPNCAFKWIIQDFQFKIVCTATRDILRGEELSTLQCVNGTESVKVWGCYRVCKEVARCSSLDGMTQTNEFPYISCKSAALKEALLVAPMFHNRPVGYNETHSFGQMESAFVIVQNGRTVRASGCHVLQCYRNAMNEYIYVVRVVHPAVVEYHVPRWILFHFFEDAVFAIRQVLTDREKQNIFQYTTPTLNCQYAESLQCNLVPCYVRSWFSRTIPKATLYRLNYQGSTAIGLANHEMRLMNLDSGKFSDQKALVSSMISTFCGEHTLATSTNVALCQSSTRRIRPSYVIPFQEMYFSNWRASFDSAVAEVRENSMMQRITNHAVEVLTFLCKSRCRQNQHRTFPNIIKSVKTLIEWYYVNAPPHQRRFLVYPDYLAATEVERSTSISMNWCSLCGKEFSFTQDHDRRQHFEHVHSLVALTYACPRCSARITLPSDFQSHVAACMPHFAYGLRIDTDNMVMDAMSDYAHAYKMNNGVVSIFEPGLPTVNAAGSCTRVAGRFRINHATGTPFDSNVITRRRPLQMQHSCTLLTSWDQLEQEKNTMHRSIE